MRWQFINCWMFNSTEGELWILCNERQDSASGVKPERSKLSILSCICDVLSFQKNMHQLIAHILRKGTLSVLFKYTWQLFTVNILLLCNKMCHVLFIIIAITVYKTWGKRKNCVVRIIILTTHFWVQHLKMLNSCRVVMLW